jgi:CTP:molybdopterin cytidylyltransferase MocA
MDKNTSVIILSSGLSQRMGKPKALLNWDDSTTFLEKIIDEYYRASLGKIICMINRIIEPACRSMKMPGNVKFIVNEHPEWGRFYSIKSGTAEAKDSDFCYIQNVDNPFISIKTIEALFEKRDPGAWCSPVYSGKNGHPVLLPGIILKEISRIENLDTILSDILKKYRVNRVEVDDEAILRNINTPDDYLNFIKFGGKH